MNTVMACHQYFNDYLKYMLITAIVLTTTTDSIVQLTDTGSIEYTVHSLLQDASTIHNALDNSMRRLIGQRQTLETVYILCSVGKPCSSTNKQHRGSYMSVHVLLNLLNQVGEKIYNVRFVEHSIAFSRLQ